MKTVIIDQGNLIEKEKPRNLLSYKRRKKARCEKTVNCQDCGETIPWIKFAKRKYCDKCRDKRRSSKSSRMIKGLTLKEYRHQYYLKTVALGWRHY